MKIFLAIVSLLIISLPAFSQNFIEGTYMAKFLSTHYSLSKPDENTVRIQPCQKFESQVSIDRETYIFKRLNGTDKFGWNGGSEVILDFDAKTGTLTFPNPINMQVPIILMLLHPKGTEPQNNVKTYFDETVGGYSTARILITDKARIKSGDCLIHSVASAELNDYIVGSYTGLYVQTSTATFRADHTGEFLGLPMTWSIVSDYKGAINKGAAPDGSFVIHLLIEFVDKYPSFIDPPSPGHKVATLQLMSHFGGGVMEIHQMQKNK